MSSGENFVEVPEAQPWDLVSTEDNAAQGLHDTAATEDDGAAATNGLVIAASVAEHAVSTVSSPQSPVLGFSTRTVVGNNSTSSETIKPKVLFAPSLSELNIVGAGTAIDIGTSAHVDGGASIANGTRAVIDNGKGPADEAKITLEDYKFLATEEYNAQKAFNDLDDEQKQCKKEIEKCKAEKRRWVLVGKEIDQRSDAAKGRYVHTIDVMAKVRQEQTDAQDNFERARKAMRDHREAGASER
jgi:hypothetical protein